ncbi:DUF4234 domain-containing protein [Natrialbaceae archaeon A-arb3/5]
MSEQNIQLTNPSAFSVGSLGKQILFAVITLGLYTIYWWYATNKQLNEGTSAEFNPVLRTVGLFIPLVNLYFIWQFSGDTEAVTDMGGVVMFLLYIFVPPAAWYFTQSGINDVAAA